MVEEWHEHTVLKSDHYAIHVGQAVERQCRISFIGFCPTVAKYDENLEWEGGSRKFEEIFRKHSWRKLACSWMGVCNREAVELTTRESTSEAKGECEFISRCAKFSP